MNDVGFTQRAALSGAREGHSRHGVCIEILRAGSARGGQTGWFEHVKQRKERGDFSSERREAGSSDTHTGPHGDALADVSRETAIKGCRIIIDHTLL